MIHVSTKQESLVNRRLSRMESGEVHWRTDFLRPSDTTLQDVKAVSPQAFLIEMTPQEIIHPHFHEVEQFQVFFEGEGQMGRTEGKLGPSVVHYTDAYTGYGPITASQQGLSYFALRPRKDPGAIYLHKEGYREKLRPSKKRHFSIPFVKSTQAVLGHLEGPVVEELFDNGDYSLDDGLSACIVRLGPKQSFTIQSTKQCGGQYLVNIQGVLKYAGRDCAESSVFFSEPADVSFMVEAGEAGAEFLLLQFGQSL
jgi:hypothetical protein